MSISDGDPGSQAPELDDCPIDYEIFDELRSLGDTSLLHELVSTYRLEVGRLFRSLDQALDATDVVMVASAAHAISGCSASIGATSLSAAAKSIEHLARSGSLDGWEPLMAKARGDCDSALRLLDIEVNNRTEPTWPSWLL